MLTGTTLAALDAALASAGQWLPLDPPRFAGTTIGGALAANLSGPLRASHGTARDLVLGVTVVAADGALVRGGGRVVKNVAGYDRCGRRYQKSQDRIPNSGCEEQSHCDQKTTAKRE